jgi:hypothetical protein
MANVLQQLAPLVTSSELAAPILPIAQLESLRLRATQIIDSIHALQRTIEAGGHPSAMPAWPDILSKYSILLSQTHNFSNALLQPFQTATVNTSRSKQPNVYEMIALHPRKGMIDAQLDGEVAPLLRNQQTMEVLRMENDTVRRLAEHMSTRGSLGVLGMVTPPAPPGMTPRKPEHEDVLRECIEIREDHDQRVDRAVRAVTMLKERFDWKQRVEVEVEEPEELMWDPRLVPRPADVPEADEEMASGTNSDDDDESHVEAELVQPS